MLNVVVGNVSCCVMEQFFGGYKLVIGNEFEVPALFRTLSGAIKFADTYLSDLKHVIPLPRRTLLEPETLDRTLQKMNWTLSEKVLQ